MTLRIGIVGAGANTRLQHIPGFQAIDGVEVTAVCNRSLASGQKVADEFGIAQVFDDWKKLVHSDEVDAVCVGTWPYLHCPITLEVLAANKHILTEARMCMDLGEARQMHAAAQENDRVAMIVPAPFYLLAESILLEKLQDGFFGDIIEIEVRGLGGGYNADAPLHWRQRRDFSGQNIMALGIFNETVRRYVGHEKAVIAHGKIFTSERKDPDTGAQGTVDIPESLGVVAEMESGATAVYHVSSVARLGDSFTFEFYGTKGSFKMEGGTAMAAGKVWIAGEGDSEYQPLQLPEHPRNGWRVEEEFVDAIRDGKQVTHTNFADGVKYMQFTEAVQRSLAEGRKVALAEL
ncbi:MAG: Gfo/Idh/MocA family protein [Candidatus Latescibacterota bacterium]|jgi:predicted dehydrogenase